jgi:transposase
MGRGGNGGENAYHGSGGIVPPQIVERSGTIKGLVVLPKRWIVECTFAWLGRFRRLVKDWYPPKCGQSRTQPGQ